MTELCGQGFDLNIMVLSLGAFLVFCDNKINSCALPTFLCANGNKGQQCATSMELVACDNNTI